MKTFEDMSGQGWVKIAEDQDLAPDFMQKDIAEYQDPKSADKVRINTRHKADEREAHKAQAHIHEIARVPVMRSNVTTKLRVHLCSYSCA